MAIATLKTQGACNAFRRARWRTEALENAKTCFQISKPWSLITKRSLTTRTWWPRTMTMDNSSSLKLSISKALSLWWVSSSEFQSHLGWPWRAAQTTTCLHPKKCRFLSPDWLIGQAIPSMSQLRRGPIRDQEISPGVCLALAQDREPGSETEAAQDVKSISKEAHSHHQGLKEIEVLRAVVRLMMWFTELKYQNYFITFIKRKK